MGCSFCTHPPISSLGLGIASPFQGLGSCLEGHPGGLGQTGDLGTHLGTCHSQC